MEDGTYDPVYRLTFAPEGAKKVAYAASFFSGGYRDIYNISGYRTLELWS